MTANDMMTLRALLEKSSDADLLREMIGFTAKRLMAVEVEGLTGAAHGERSPDRLTHRNGYRPCEGASAGAGESPTITPWAPAGWAGAPTRWWTLACACMGSAACGWRTPRTAGDHYRREGGGDGVGGSGAGGGGSSWFASTSRWCENSKLSPEIPELGHSHHARPVPTWDQTRRSASVATQCFKLRSVSALSVSSCSGWAI